MAASFGSGVAYSLVSGSPNPLQSAVTTGMAFALFNGLFYQVQSGAVLAMVLGQQQLLAHLLQGGSEGGVADLFVIVVHADQQHVQA